MKSKKAIIAVATLLVLVSGFLYLKYFHGWMEFRKNTDTPKQYLSHINKNQEDYAIDKNLVLKQFRSLLARHVDFFHSKAYFDSTELIIDTILYSPDFNKLAVLLITKNPTYRQLVPEKNQKWYYDATCYLGIRNSNSIFLDWLGPDFANSPDEQHISKFLRDACFRTFVTSDTTDAYAYNLNDIRFWDYSPLWQKVIDKEKDKDN